MSLFFPKRISELANIDSDLETPEKPTKNRHFMKNVDIMPKRINDIKESDSEDEDQLNCAILNDSFVLTPSRDLDIPITPQPSKTNQQLSKEENAANKNQRPFEDNRGFVSRGVNPLKHPSSPDASKSERAPPTATDSRPVLKSRTQLFPPSHLNKRQQNETKENPVGASSTVLDNRLPLSTIKDDKNINQPEETPFKRFESHQQQQFVTPSTRIYSSTQLNSVLSAFERDPIKQPISMQQPKVLFRTPVARTVMSADTRLPLSSLQKLSPVKEKPKENCITINSIDYEIGNQIGSGGSSSVFLAKGRKSGKECAIKLVHLDGDAQIIEGYLNETRLLAKLQGNINVVALYDYCHLPEKQILYMVMEKGESDLHKVLQKFTTHLPLYTLTNYWYQILQAVNYIHQNGVIHSDLKPANFLMINDRLKLIDFGIASNIAIDSTSIIKFSQAGTFNYISPEALIDTSNDDSPSTHHQPKIRLSTKSDVWSLGCILYLLLYKKTPFSHIKNLHQKVNALTDPKTAIDYPKLPNFYPDMLLEMLKKCLIHNPKERSSVADLLKYPFHMIIPIDQ